ncbi:MAG: hypothetical protein JXR73_15955 [Candidatus Omnitrophica bacterium]|nr:hypothetical protein [Candidatus Omnitrophota bacterium]
MKEIQKNPDPVQPALSEEEKNAAQFWMRTIVIVSLFLASMTVLDAFITLFTYLAFLAGRIDPNQYQEWHKAFEEIQKAPYLFIIMNLYNIVLWNGVIVCCIWFLRYHAWLRKQLKNLLGLDMIVTVVHLLWEVSQGDARISSPGLFVVMNAMQVGVIIALSHPRIVELLEKFSLQQKQAVQSLKNSDL